MKRHLLAIPLVMAPLAANAQDTKPEPNDQTLIVTATPNKSLSPLTTPGALSVDYGDDIRQAQPQVNLSEGLSDVPGLQIQNRQNYAQDLQLSLRGFGARSTFGVRGLRIYQDGIPATMPDGQSQISNIDLSSVERIEVLRGPFSALYGNASGGVINIISQTGRQPNSLESSNYYGSFGSWRSGIKAQGALGDGDQAGDVNYLLSTSRFSTQGFRQQSSAHRDVTNAKLGVTIDDRSSLTFTVNNVDIKANDPGGLTNDEWHDDPRQAPRAQQYQTRKTVQQTQAGLVYQLALTDHDDFSISGWAGLRETVQYQSIPVAVQRPAQHPGGVIDLTRRYQGIDTRWTHRTQVGVIPLSFTTGINYETMTEQRKGYENFISVNGNTLLGEKGQLRRNERNKMWNIDPYLQTSWQLTPRLTLDAGVRFSQIKFDSQDHYITALNGDDSGKASYHRWLPVAALKYDIDAAWNVYLSAGRGYETPTINELSYRSDGQSGLNFALQPSTSETLELGSKMRVGNGLISAAIFETNTKNEIVTASSSNGRSSYQNAGSTQRRGLELAWDQAIASNWRLKMAWTLLDAHYKDDAGTTIKSGNRMPGIARNSVFASLGWQPEQGWYAGGDIRYLSQIAANDANTANAPAYTTVALNTGYKWVKGNWVLNGYTRVDNLLDRHYVGSVIVNESNGRYYEPAPGRNYGVGLSLAYSFE